MGPIQAWYKRTFDDGANKTVGHRTAAKAVERGLAAQAALCQRFGPKARDTTCHGCASDEQGTIIHRYFRCPGTRPLRRTADPRCVQLGASATTDAEISLWTRGLVADPAARYAYVPKVGILE